jgi:hypothetical protein
VTLTVACTSEPWPGLPPGITVPLDVSFTRLLSPAVPAAPTASMPTWVTPAGTV